MALGQPPTIDFEALEDVLNYARSKGFKLQRREIIEDVQVPARVVLQFVQVGVKPGGLMTTSRMSHESRS